MRTLPEAPWRLPGYCFEGVDALLSFVDCVEDVSVEYETGVQDDSEVFEVCDPLNGVLFYNDGVSWFGGEAHGLGLVPGDPEAKPGTVVV